MTGAETGVDDTCDTSSISAASRCPISQVRTPSSSTRLPAERNQMQFVFLLNHYRHLSRPPQPSLHSSPTLQSCECCPPNLSHLSDSVGGQERLQSCRQVEMMAAPPAARSHTCCSYFYFWQSSFCPTLNLFSFQF